MTLYSLIVLLRIYSLTQLDATESETDSQNPIGWHGTTEIVILSPHGGFMALDLLRQMLGPLCRGKFVVVYTGLVSV